MQVRLPMIDYSQVRPHWAPNREFAQSMNAASTIPSFIEPWLIKVMNRALAELPASEEKLKEDVRIFIAQEAQHYRQHNAFNRSMFEAYPQVQPLYDQMERDMEEMLEKKSLKYWLAYSEGFETLGPVAASLWFGELQPYLDGADHEAVALWKWHMAEEYEHREVCYKLLRALYARTLWGRFWNGWLYRCYGFIRLRMHLGKYTKAVGDLLMAADQKGMTEEERQASDARLRAFRKLMKKTALPAALKVFSPFYNPAHVPVPKGMWEYLRRFERGGDMGRDVPPEAAA